MRTIRLLKDTDGDDMVEYALILAFIVIAGAAVVMQLGPNITTIWSVVNSRLASANQ